ncbi:Glycine cleavage T-protein N-terminal [Penicillium sp. DV-2018c]|nr:Glycine cleavage T-protein N-terminal [Penicillium sp. DV-2018c]KAJ5563453.1 Glycine cleavage T-protein N-terminal [Penicillium sp. DV-2018c]
MMRPRHAVCTRCLSRSRLFSTKAQQNAPFPPTAGYSRLTNRGLICITGHDSTTFLQGLMTQNMLVANDPNRNIRRTGAYTAFLNSQGRVLNDAFIYPLPGAEAQGADSGWLVEVDKDQVPVLIKHLKKHKLRAKLKLRALEEGERTIWSSWKNHAEPQRWAAYSLESDSSSPFSPTSEIAGCVDTRAPGFGSRIVTPGSDGLRTHFADEAQIPGPEVQLDSYTVRRILHGVAEGQREIISGSALPLQCNMDMARGIDFRKGCYVGQELTIRTHHRGVTRKRLLPVQLYDLSQDGVSAPDNLTYDPSAQFALPAGEADIVKAGTATRRNRSAGTFLNGIGNIGLALCRLEVMTDVALMGETPARPEEHHFKLSWPSDAEQPDQEVGVRAFVPPWLRDFISGGKEAKPARGPEGEGERAREFVEQLEEEEAEAHRQ